MVRVGSVETILKEITCLYSHPFPPRCRWALRPRSARRRLGWLQRCPCLPVQCRHRVLPAKASRLRNSPRRWASCSSPWVQNILPFVTSITAHAVLIILMMVVFKVVVQKRALGS